MVLSSFSFDIPEADLRTLCDCTALGTDALQAVDAMRQLGFTSTAKYTLSIDELEGFVANEHNPTVLVDLRPIDSVKGTHALVVVGVSETDVNVYDPAQGERFLPRHTFNHAWAMQRNLAIIVEE